MTGLAISRLVHFGLAWILCGACGGGSDVLVGYNRSGAEGGRSGLAPVAGTSGQSIGSEAESAGAPSGGAPGYCSNGGPSIELPTVGGCTNDLAKRVFLFAICTCSDFSSTGSLTTDSVDSLTGMTRAEPDLGGSVGVNGVYRADEAESVLGGSLWVGGDAEFAWHAVAGDLQCGGSLAVTDESEVMGSAYVFGDVSAPSLTIAQTLYVPEDGSIELQAARGGIVNQSVVVPAPCDCRNPVDVAGIVDHFESNNDNEAAGIVASQLAQVDRDVELTLPCGSYYLESAGGTGAIKLHLTGKTAIAVGQRFSNSGGLAVDLGSDAELDLFVGGDVEISGTAVLGSSSRPAATRIYVGGQVALSSNLSAYANWYVPNQLFAMSTRSEFWGSIHAQSLQLSGTLTVHYDRAIQTLPSCTPSGQSCDSCRDCSNPTPACRNGECTACQIDGDCCPPLHCNRGLCTIDPEVL